MRSSEERPRWLNFSSDPARRPPLNLGRGTFLRSPAGRPERKSIDLLLCHKILSLLPLLFLLAWGGGGGGRFIGAPSPPPSPAATPVRGGVKLDDEPEEKEGEGGETSRNQRKKRRKKKRSKKVKHWRLRFSDLPVWSERNKSRGGERARDHFNGAPDIGQGSRLGLATL